MLGTTAAVNPRALRHMRAGQRQHTDVAQIVHEAEPVQGVERSGAQELLPRETSCAAARRQTLLRLLAGTTARALASHPHRRRRSVAIFGSGKLRV